MRHSNSEMIERVSVLSIMESNAVLRVCLKDYLTAEISLLRLIQSARDLVNHAEVEMAAAEVTLVIRYLGMILAAFIQGEDRTQFCPRIGNR